MAGEETDPAVRIGTLGSVFKVSFDGTAHVGELAANLVMTAGVQFDFQQVITLRGLNQGVFETGFFAVF